MIVVVVVFLNSILMYLDLYIYLSVSIYLNFQVYLIFTVQNLCVWRWWFKHLKLLPMKIGK